MKIQNIFTKNVITLFISTALIACGSSNSGDDSTSVDTPVTTNTPPIANAGGNQTVILNEIVNLSASASSDSDSDALTYSWSIQSAPTNSNAALNNNTNETTSFTADIEGSYTITLIVNDGTTDSEKVTTIITAIDQIASTTDITDIALTSQAGSCADYVGEYASNVSDIKRNMTFNGSIHITVNGSKCSLSVNEIPNHDFNDQSASFATNVSSQSGSYQVDVTPQMENDVTEVTLGTRNAIFLNGVMVDLLAAACYDVGNEPLGQEKVGCGPDQINNPWRYDPMSNLNSFGTDQHNAHTQPDGTYHYHGNPLALFDTECESNAQESPVIGFAADGYPIFGPCINVNGAVREANSSFTLKSGTRQSINGYTTPVSGTGDINSNTYDGQFRGDYEYTAGAGDLDECNGMTVNGQYGYYITNAFPWVLNCFKGTPDASFTATGPALQNLMHSHDDEQMHIH